MKYDPLERLIDLLAQVMEEDDERFRADMARAGSRAQEIRTAEQKSAVARKGWATRKRLAAEHVDEVAVEGGRPVVLTPPEQAAAYRRLATSGLSDAQIAERVGVGPRTVLRWRQRDGVESRWVA